MGFHRDAAIGDIHYFHNWEYDNATLREAATGFVASDVFKLALQKDDYTLWILVATTPSWISLGEATIPGGNVDLDVRKGSAGTIPAGTPFYASGYNVAGWVEVEAADASDPNKMPAIGMHNAGITNSATASVTVSGSIGGLDTSGTSVGDPVYVSSSTGWTTTKPQGVNKIQKIGEILRVHATAGVILMVGAGRVNDLPNLAENKVWKGDSNGVPQEVTLDKAAVGLGNVDNTSDLNKPVSTATQTAIDNAVTGLYDHKGEYNASTNTPDLDVSPSGVQKGDAYTVSAAGDFFTEAVEAGDILIADQDNPTLLTHWTRVNKNIELGTTGGTACEGNDSRLPTQDENDALAGTGTPSASNKYVTADGLPTVSDTAYSESGWNANNDAATKNAIRDKFESLKQGDIGYDFVDFSGAGPHTVLASHKGKMIRVDHTAAATLNFNTGLGTGFHCAVYQKGVGQVTIAGTATLRNPYSYFKTEVQYTIIDMLNVGTDELLASGALVP